MIQGTICIDEKQCADCQACDHAPSDTSLTPEEQKIKEINAKIVEKYNKMLEDEAEQNDICDDNREEQNDEF